MEEVTLSGPVWRVAGSRLLIKCKSKNLSAILTINFIFDSIWVNVVPPDGIPRRYAAKSGESLLDVLERNETPGVFADCAGGDLEHTMAPY